MKEFTSKFWKQQQILGLTYSVRENGSWPILPSEPTAAIRFTAAGKAVATEAARTAVATKAAGTAVKLATITSSETASRLSAEILGQNHIIYRRIHGNLSA